MPTKLIPIVRLNERNEYVLVEMEGEKLLRLEVPRHLQRRGYGSAALDQLKKETPSISASSRGDFNDVWLTKHGVALV